MNTFSDIDQQALTVREDVGIQYRTGVYFKLPEDKIVIENFISEKNKEYKGKIAVEVREETGFFPPRITTKIIWIKPWWLLSCRLEFTTSKRKKLKKQTLIYVDIIKSSWYNKTQNGKLRSEVSHSFK